MARPTHLPLRPRTHTLKKAHPMPNRRPVSVFLRRILAGTCALLALASGASAAGAPSLDEARGTYAIDPSSRIRFSVDQVGGGGIAGTFGKFSGHFKLDNRDIGKSVVQFVLYPASVVTGEARVESFLRSSAVFDTEAHATITFNSTTITRTSEDSADIDGQLTARGITRTERFHAKLTQWNRRTIAFDITGGIYRSRYGMDVGTPIYSNVVQFNMSVTGRRE